MADPHVIPTPPPIPPRRSIVECSSLAPAQSHVIGYCSIHTENHLTVFCTDCVQLLCRQCLKLPDYHSDCSLCHFNNDTTLLREQLSSSVGSHTDELVASFKNLRRALLKKRERMLKKKNETISEIERYFTKLRAKINAKLKKDEKRLMETLKERVTEQEILISDSVNECEAILNTVREKSSDVRDHSSEPSDLACIKNIVNIQRENDAFKSSKHEIEKTRDAFLVIRFFVNSDTEDNILKSSPAYVEVLNSRENNENQMNLESERINEVSMLQASAIESDIASDTEIDNTGLSVNLPESSSARINGRGYQRASQDLSINVCHRREGSGASSRGPSRNSNRGSNSSSRSNTPDNLLSTSAIGSRSNTPDLLSDSRSSTPARTSPSIVRSSTPNTETVQMEGACSNEFQGNDTDLSNAVANTQAPRIVTSSPDSNASENIDEDEPPPPYPGLPTQPGPNELPPPYPGPPPPAYTQSPEPQQTTASQSRGRLFGESDRSQAASPIPNEVLLSPSSTSRPYGLHEPNVVNVKQLKSFSISEFNDKRSSSISAMAVFNRRYFLVIDRWNKKLKYFSARGESYGGLIFREEPWDIAEITTDLFAVTVPKLNSIYKIQGTGDQVIAKSTVITERQYACVAYQSQNEVFVCGQVPQFGEPVIDVIGINGGPVLLTFRTTIHGQELFSYPRYVQVSDDNTVVVCDWNLKCVVFFQSDGTIVAKYKGTSEFPLHEPTGITLNREMNKVFVIDSKRDSTQGVIHRVSMNGVCEHVYERQDDFRDSRAISSYGDRISTGSKSGIINTYSITNRRHIAISASPTSV